MKKSPTMSRAVSYMTLHNALILLLTRSRS